MSGSTPASRRAIFITRTAPEAVSSGIVMWKASAVMP
jgi:hypothetical protein